VKKKKKMFLFFSVADPNLVTNKQFQSKETLVYSRLVKYAMQALDIYTINVATNGHAFVRPAA
jgi:transformation/transcription domain-associated protein